jgi:hypothetical protein
MVDVVPIFVTPIQSPLLQDNIGVTYARTSNFRMEQVTYVPLYFMAMPRSIITITEASFVSALVNIVVGITSRPQTPRGAKFLSLHEAMPQKVNIVFISQPLDQGRGSSNPPRPRIFWIVNGAFK